MITKEKLLSSLIFSIFLTGSTIIYHQLVRWVAIGIVLEVLAIYLLIKLEINALINEIKSEEEEKST